MALNAMVPVDVACSKQQAGRFQGDAQVGKNSYSQVKLALLLIQLQEQESTISVMQRMLAFIESCMRILSKHCLRKVPIVWFRQHPVKHGAALSD